MRCPYRRILAILLFAVMFCSPIYGHDYFLDLVSTAESSDIESGCVISHGVSSHEAKAGPQHIMQCHELEQPGIIAPALIIHYSPTVSTLASSDKDAGLPGYRPQIRIPPRSHVYLSTRWFLCKYSGIFIPIYIKERFHEKLKYF